MWQRKNIFTFLLFLIFTGQIASQTLEIPLITNVSVDKTSQKVQISWSMSNSSNVDGYIVLRQIFGQPGVVDGTFNTIVTINNSSQFSYLDNGTDYGSSKPGNVSENYRVASFKIVAGVTIYSNMSNTVSSIYQAPVAFNLCLEQNNLSWSAYNGFGTELAGYRIYYSNAQLGTPVLLQDVGANQTSFVHNNLVSNSSYFYYIEAYNSNKTLISNSNIQLVNTTMPAVPQIMYANFGTVEHSNEINLSFTVDPDAVVASYILLKSSKKDGSYDSIASFPRGSSIITYTDFIKTNKEIYYYKMVSKNTCGIKSHESNIAHNLVLEAFANKKSDQSNQIRWNLYEGWTNGVLNYSIYRSVDNSPFEEIATVPSTIGAYNDDISQFIKPEIGGKPTEGNFCYYVQANESPGNIANSIGVSRSNIACAHQETVIYVPNAFNPNSHTDVNRTFKPVISFVNDYLIIIYNRFGDILFQSNDPTLGWDGKNKNGDLLTRGTYVYYLKYTSKENQKVEKSGQINLVY